MVLGPAYVELGVPPVAVGRIGILRLPLVVTEVRLGEGDEHPHIIRGPKDLGKTQVRPRLAAIVVGIYQVDPDRLEPLEALASTCVAGQRGADLSVVERDSAKEYASSVEVEIAAVNPEF